MISPLTGTCDLCGYAANSAGSVAVEHLEPTDEMARRELGHAFTIDAVLGQGVASSVYLAHEAGDTNRHVVLKVLPRQLGQPDADERFRQAMSQVGALDHPHIVRIIRFGSSDSLFWYSAERVQARTLRDVLRAQGKLDLRTTLRMAAQIASALEHLHRRGLVHGALKAENVLMEEAGWIRLCDPLLSRALQHAHGEEHGPAADQQALAAVLYECLGGVAPAHSPAPLRTVQPDVPPHVSLAITRALDGRPGNRFPTVLDFLATLETGTLQLTDTRPSATRPAALAMIPGWMPPPRDRRRSPVIWSVLAVVATAAVVVWSWLGNSAPGEQWEYVPAPATPDSASPASAAPATPIAGTTGTLFINATPWGHVYLDGRLTGTTPTANLTVAAGLHAIRVTREGFVPFERTIRVGAGETVPVSITLVERRQ